MANLPLRTCLATNEKHPKSTLLRFVNVAGVPTPDPTQTLPGRGTYILPTEAAYTVVLKRKAFAYKLKTSKPPLPWPEIAQMLDITRHQGHKAPKPI
jgi:predicted RNA-binding protein YlxR (DUF448 family)